MSNMETITQEYTYKLLGCAYEVHKALGPGLLESVYKKALKRELETNGFKVDEEKPITIDYKGIRIADNLKIDLLVDNKIILELKSVETLKEVHFKQLMTYLRLTGCNLGYLINFNVDKLKDGGIHRVVNHFKER